MLQIADVAFVLIRARADEHLRRLERLSPEAVALDEDGESDFPQLCECVLLRQRSAALAFIVFDVLSVERRNAMNLGYAKRREILVGLGLNDRLWTCVEISS